MAAINRRVTDLTESTISSSGSSLHSRSSSESLDAPSDTTAPSIHENDIDRADDPTAIVGLACRLPGAQSSSKLWENILEQKDLQSKIPADRFNVDEFYHPNGANKGTVRISSFHPSCVADNFQSNATAGYFLDQDLSLFDPEFFRISGKEAEAMDPQQRLLLEVVYEALEDGESSSVPNMRFMS